MNELKDNDIREALRRMEERRTPAKVPFDFCDKVMQEIEPKRKKRGKTVATFLAIAASISLALLMVLPHEKNDEKQTSTTDDAHLVVLPHQTETVQPNNSLPSVTEKKAEKIMANRVVSKKKANEEQNTSAMTDNIAEKAVVSTPSDVDSLEYFIDKIEQELAHVDESLYIERINKVIQADERLQRIVDQYIIHRIVSDEKPQTVQTSNPQNINHYEE